MKKIIIGIPIYNGALTIERTFASLRKAIVYCKNLYLCDIEIVFVLNGCADESEKIVKDIIEFNTDLTIRMISIERACKAMAINILRDNEADYIGYVDDDIIFDEEAIFEEVILLDSDDDIWGVFVDPFPLPSRDDIGWWGEIVYSAMTIRTRFNLLAERCSFLIGRCVLLRRDKMPLIPGDTINEDQYLDYSLYPHIKKVTGPFVFYEGIYSIGKYFQRDIRITAGRKQLQKSLPREITGIADRRISRKISYKKLFELPISSIFIYIIYRIIYRASKVVVGVCLLINKKPQWKRTN